MATMLNRRRRHRVLRRAQGGVAKRERNWQRRGVAKGSGVVKIRPNQKVFNQASRLFQSCIVYKTKRLYAKDLDNMRHGGVHFIVLQWMNGLSLEPDHMPNSYEFR